MTPEQLKNSILQLAIQGKLVEQRKEEGTGEELYKEIQEEKKKLIKEGKLKKQKFLPEITEDEVPFDIPETWRWVRSSDALNITMGQSPESNSVNYDNLGCEFHQGKSNFGNKFLNTSSVYTTSKSKIIESPAIVMSVRAPVGDVNLIKNQIFIGRGLAAFQIYTKCNLDYIFYYFLTIKSSLESVSTGSTFKAINSTTVKNIFIPLPPLAEQKRIVEKIEELLPLVDRYEKAWTRLEELNKKFPLDMQKSILQEAIQGKLVEQRKEEGTGEELFKEIQKEKQKLIKDGKLKKQKALPEITKDEIPFDIPESWKWIRVGEIFAHNTGKAMNSTAKKVDKPGSVKRFITTSNLYWNSFDFSSVKEMFFSDDELERCTVTKGDLLMCEGGAYYGRTAIWNYDYDICFQNHVHRLRPYKAVELRFFYHLFYFYKSMNMVNAKGTAMPGLSSQTLHQMVVPLPPFSEQKRIVAKIEELLPLCERLK